MMVRHFEITVKWLLSVQHSKIIAKLNYSQMPILITNPGSCGQGQLPLGFGGNAGNKEMCTDKARR